MVEYGVNLLRGRVPDRRRRALFYRGLLVYLGVVGLVLALSAYAATRRAVAAADAAREVQRQRQQFREQNSGEADLAGFDRVLRNRLLRAAERTEFVADLLSQRMPVGLVMNQLASALPADVVLMAFESKGSAAPVTFRIAMPVQRKEPFTANALVDLWNADPLLAPHLRNITLVLSQQQRLDRRSVYLWSFTAQWGAHGEGG